MGTRYRWGRGGQPLLFQKGADKLSREEAILLAIALPSPILRNPAKPTPKMLKLADMTDGRMRILFTRYSCVLR